MMREGGRDGEGELGMGSMLVGWNFSAVLALYVKYVQFQCRIPHN